MKEKRSFLSVKEMVEMALLVSLACVINNSITLSSFPLFMASLYAIYKL